MSDAPSAVLPEAAQGYGTTTRALHWAAALLIFGAWGLGISLEQFPRGPERAAAIGVHSSLGLLVLTLSVLRILWRSVTRAPAPEGPGWMVAAARLGHLAFYVLTVALPVSGLLARWARSGSASLVGGWSIPTPFPLPASKLWAQAHDTIAFTLAALVVAHVAAALFHHLVLRDGVLRRMLPAIGSAPRQDPRLSVTR